jgi:hypothetical protein
MAMRRRDVSVLGTVLTAGALALTGMVAAAPVRADTVAYLDDLRNAGINTPRGEPEMKEWGWAICALLGRDVDPDRVRTDVVYNSGSSPQYGMTVEQADDVVHFAAIDLCADHK